MKATLEALTVEEKRSLVSGTDLWHTRSVDRVGVPALKVTDGPNGARGSDGNHGPTSTNFPCPAAMGATWDRELVEEVGVALARETRAKGAHVLLGPTVNIPRVPVAGRNFECYSEDPLLAGLLAAAWIRGIQSQHVAACIKHFVCNDQEQDRFEIDAVVDERPLREIYLEPFRIAVESARPWAAMSAYNTINGVTASEHPMLNEVLRYEFGFDGLVMSDWFGTYSDGVMTSGLDLEMPGPGRWLGAEATRAALATGTASEADLDRKVTALLTLLERTRAASRSDTSEIADEPAAHRTLARRVATESMVLLTNDGTLPLGRPPTIAVIGELAARTPTQGGGSSSVNPHRQVSILEGIREAVGGEADVRWAPGYSIRKGASPFDPATLSDGGFLIEYFDNPTPEGVPARSVRTTRSFINLFGTEDEWLNFDRCAIRVTGNFTAAASGRHVFRFAAEGRLRTLFDNTVVLDLWDGAAEGGTVERDLTEGDTIEIVIEFASVERPGLHWRFVSLGCDGPHEPPALGDAVAAAAEADIAIVVVGMTLEWESEGFDRPNLELPGTQDQLIAAVAEAQPNTVVVVTAGSPILMPWVGDVAATLWAWYGGQEVGHAVADVLFGSAEPGGRLPVTFPATPDQHPGLAHYPGADGRVRYGEGVHVGYRGFDHLGLEPAFEFGHGLSYTQFAAEAASVDASLEVSLMVRNLGSRTGSDVVRVFAHNLGEVPRRLVGFAKVRPEPGQAEPVTIAIQQEALRTWGDSGWSDHAGPLSLSVVGRFGTVRLDTHT